MTTLWTGQSNEIECEGCANSIKRTLGKLSGVSTVEVEVDTKTIRVAYDSAQTSEEVLKGRLEAAGFPVGVGVA